MCGIWIWSFWAFSTHVCPIKGGLSGNTVRPPASRPKWAIFKELLSTQNTNVAGKFECDFFFFDFPTHLLWWLVVNMTCQLTFSMPKLWRNQGSVGCRGVGRGLSPLGMASMAFAGTRCHSTSSCSSFTSLLLLSLLSTDFLGCRAAAAAAAATAAPPFFFSSTCRRSRSRYSGEKQLQ